MTVHVGEIASEVSATGPSATITPEPKDPPRGPGIAEEEWDELRQRARWTAERTWAEGFSD